METWKELTAEANRCGEQFFEIACPGQARAKLHEAMRLNRAATHALRREADSCIGAWLPSFPRGRYRRRMLASLMMATETLFDERIDAQWRLRDREQAERQRQREANQ